MTAKITYGEIVSWIPPSEVSFSVLQDALYQSGLDATLAGNLLPRYAFNRAAKKLSDNRVIRQVNEDNDSLWFQFTREHFQSSLKEYKYNIEAKLRLWKSSGKVECSIPELATEAHGLILNEMGSRKATDVTNIIHRIFKNSTPNGDLFPVRPRGAVYFVPDEYSALLDNLESFLSFIGGKLSRWKISGEENKESVGAAICTAVEKMIDDYADAVNEYDPGTPSTDELKACVDRVVKIEGMISSYGYVLEDLSKQLRASLLTHGQELEEKIKNYDPQTAEKAKQEALETSQPLSPVDQAVALFNSVK